MAEFDADRRRALKRLGAANYHAPKPWDEVLASCCTCFAVFPEDDAMEGIGIIELPGFGDGVPEDAIVTNDRTQAEQLKAILGGGARG